MTVPNPPAPTDGEQSFRNDATTSIAQYVEKCNTEFSEEELYKIAIGLAKNFKFNGDKKILEDLVKFHKAWSNSDDIKDDVQCFTIREIAASVKAFSEGSNIYDTIMTIYGARYPKFLKEKLERLLRSFGSFEHLTPSELIIPQNFPNCFKNKALLEAIKSIKFSLENNRHVIISGIEGSGKTQLALWFAEWYTKKKKYKKKVYILLSLHRRIEMSRFNRKAKSY